VIIIDYGEIRCNDRHIKRSAYQEIQIIYFLLIELKEFFINFFCRMKVLGVQKSSEL